MTERRQRSWQTHKSKLPGNSRNLIFGQLVKLVIRYSEFIAQYDVAEAASHLSELADKAADGEEIIFRKGAEQFQIIRVSPSFVTKPIRQPGTGGKGWMSPDFDEPLEEMSEYM